MVAFSAVIIGFLAVSATADPYTLRAQYNPYQRSPNAPVVSEQQKRAAFVPTVRVASDCMARAVGSDPKFDAAVIGDQIRTLIPAAVDKCTQPLAEMIRAHDRIYGAGTGLDFAKGPYLEDLPRAIENRMKDRIAIIRDTENRRQAMASARADDTRRARDRARDVFWTCAEEEARSLVRSGERAELVATAVLGSCREEEGRLIDAAIAVMEADGMAASDARAPASRTAFEKSLREGTVSVVVRAMAEAKSLPAPVAAPVAATPAPADYTKLASCIDKVAQPMRSVLTETSAKVEVVVELCRPEIEEMARSEFIANGATDLDGARERAFGRAKETAGAALNR